MDMIVAPPVVGRKDCRVLPQSLDGHLHRTWDGRELKAILNMDPQRIYSIL